MKRTCDNCYDKCNYSLVGHVCDCHTLDYTELSTDKFIELLMELGMDRNDISLTKPGKGGIYIGENFVEDMDLKEEI